VLFVTRGRPPSHSFRFRLGRLAVTFACALALIVPVPANVLAQGPHRIAEWGERMVAMPACKGSNDSDCIEPLLVRSGGTWQTARLIDVQRVHQHHTGFEPGFSGILTWQYESTVEGLVTVDMHTVMYPRGVTYRGADYLFHGFDIHVARRVDEANPDPLAGVTFDCDLGTLRNCLLGPRLPDGDLFEVSVRTSWVKNNGASIDGRDPYFKHRKRAGTDVWTFGARQGYMSVPRPGHFSNDSMPSAGWQPYLHFLLAHAGDGVHDSAFDPRCAAHGAPWQSALTWGEGRLKWVKSQRTLDFEIHAPHLDPHGRPLRGEFTAEIPLDWLRCFAGKKVRPALLSVSVTTEDGVDQVATTSLRVLGDVVRVRAYGFHFSSPTIRLHTQHRRT